MTPKQAQSEIWGSAKFDRREPHPGYAQPGSLASCRDPRPYMDRRHPGSSKSLWDRVERRKQP